MPRRLLACLFKSPEGRLDHKNPEGENDQNDSQRGKANLRRYRSQTTDERLSLVAKLETGNQKKARRGKGPKLERLCFSSLLHCWQDFCLRPFGANSPPDATGRRTRSHVGFALRTGIHYEDTAKVAVH